MKERNLATRLAAVPDLARDAMPTLPWRTPAPRVWTAPKTLVAFGLGLAVGTALGLLLRLAPIDGEMAEEDPEMTPDS